MMLEKEVESLSEHDQMKPITIAAFIWAATSFEYPRRLRAPPTERDFAV